MCEIFSISYNNIKYDKMTEVKLLLFGIAFAAMSRDVVTNIS